MNYSVFEVSPLYECTKVEQNDLCKECQWAYPNKIIFSIGVKSSRNWELELIYRQNCFFVVLL